MEGVEMTEKPIESGVMTTSMNIRRDQWELLHDVALAIRQHEGNRASVSSVLRDLIDQNWNGLMHRQTVAMVKSLPAPPPSPYSFTGWTAPSQGNAETPPLKEQGA